jgi:hypothetical protein
MSVGSQERWALGSSDSSCTRESTPTEWRALESLDQLALIVEVVNDLGTVARRALRSKLRNRQRPISNPR